MARLRSVPRPPKLLAKAGNNVSVLTFEERTRVSNFFMLLVEIDFRLPKSTKTKARTRKGTKTKAKHRPIKKDPCYIKCPAMCCSSRTAQRDLFLKPFTRIFNSNKSNFIMGYGNDRHHSFIANA